MILKMNSETNFLYIALVISMKIDTNIFMSTDHNSDVLKIFGIDSNIIEHYDIFHRKDGVHIILKLINREQRCPVWLGPEQLKLSII